MRRFFSSVTLWASCAGSPADAHDETSVLPPPTGAHPVGRTVRCFVDPLRAESLSDDPEDHRALVVTFWYPAESVPGGDEAPYREPTADDGESIRTHAQADAPVSAGEEGLPLVVSTHGDGVDPALYTGLCVEIASRGFIVAAINHTFGSSSTTLPDGRTIPYRSAWPEGADRRTQAEAKIVRAMLHAEDISFVLEQLEDLSGTPDLPLSSRVDFEQVAVMGHSLGGFVAGLAAMDDDRIDACIHLDSSVYQGLQIEHEKPLLLFNVDRSAVNDQHDHGQEGATHQIVVHGGGHMHFSDPVLLDCHRHDRPESDRRQAWSILSLTRAYVREFLAKHLQGAPSPLFDVSVTIKRG